MGGIEKFIVDCILIIEKVTKERRWKNMENLFEQENFAMEVYDCPKSTCTGKCQGSCKGDCFGVLSGYSSK